VYLVLKGTTVRVKKADGRIVEHRMKRNLAIPSGECQFLGYDLHYAIRDYTVIVRADQAIHADSQCPQCKRLL
jgi:hypothetical protein